MLRVLLNSPCNFYTSSELLTIPIGLSYIKSYCETNFACKVKIVPVLDQRVINKERPDIVGISCFAATYDRAKALAKLCKSNGLRVVVGGEQITTLPHLITKDMDIGVRGEGEHVFLELLRRYGNGWKMSDLRDLPGLVYRHDGTELKIGNPTPAPMNLDELPMPDFLLGNENTDLLCLMTSRGCPYRCAFCATGWHKNVHWLSPQRLIETIEYHLEKYPRLRRVKFWDDLFTVKYKRVERIVELLEERGLTRQLSFTICTRADHINDALLRLLKRMNCTHVSMGLESGSDKTLAYINKKCTVETNRHAVELLDVHRFNSESSFIVGFPEETHEDIQQTYDFIKQVPIKKIQVFLPIPYPGTQLWQHAMKKGVVSEDMKWERLDLIATMVDPSSVLEDYVILSEKLSREDLYRWLVKFRRIRKWKTFKFATFLLLKNPFIIYQRLKREIIFYARKLLYSRNVN